MRGFFIALLIAPTLPAYADSVVATRALPAHHLIGAEDLRYDPKPQPDALVQMDLALGMETRSAIAAGRAIRARDLSAPRLIERNAKVTLVYAIDGLSITAPGRALDRAGAGDMLRVLNLSSKTTVTGIVTASGEIRVDGL